VTDPLSAVSDPVVDRRILLVEDDHGDAVLVQANLGEAGIGDDAVTWSRSLAEARLALAGGPDCILLDLGLPDAQGLGAVSSMVEAAPDIPVIVLTGRQERDGIDALAAGAQDYLVKDALTGELLERSIRYAVERNRAQRAQQQLREIQLSAAEQGRLERGLLPRPLLRTGTVECATYYHPGRDHAVLGGDFFDIVETPDGVVHAIIGDVMGHGPDEAALGVHLRVAWRTLLLAGTPEPTVLPTLARLLATEETATRFATVCVLAIDATGMSVRVAGHPAPIVGVGPAAHYLDVRIGPPLGVALPRELDTGWPENRVELAPASSVLLYTDGLLDAYTSRAGSIGIDELVDDVSDALSRGATTESLIPDLVARAPRESADDTAAVVLATPPFPPRG
jgi:serine phosphatase RsbU (regulator of sigma subunit)